MRPRTFQQDNLLPQLPRGPCVRRVVVVVLSRSNVITIGSSGITVFRIGRDRALPRRAQLYTAVLVAGNTQFDHSVKAFHDPSHARLTGLTLSCVSFDVDANRGYSIRIPARSRVQGVRNTGSHGSTTQHNGLSSVVGRLLGRSV